MKTLINKTTPNGRIEISVFKKDGKYYLKHYWSDSHFCSLRYENLIIERNQFISSALIARYDNSVYRGFLKISIPNTRESITEITQKYYDIAMEDFRVKEVESRDLGPLTIRLYKSIDWDCYYTLFNYDSSFRPNQDLHIEDKTIAFPSGFGYRSSLIANGFKTVICPKYNFREYSPLSLKTWQDFWSDAQSPGYYVMNKRIYRTCKELFLKDLSRLEFAERKFTIYYNKISDKERLKATKLLESWKKKLPVEFGIEVYNEKIEVNATQDWWGNSGVFFYRMGWLLLAIRVALKQQILGKIQAPFDDFLENPLLMHETINKYAPSEIFSNEYGRYMDGTRNWVHFFQKSNS